MNKKCIQFKSINKSNTIFVLAYIIDICNYNCSYCYNKKPRTYKRLNLNKLLNFLILLKTITYKNIDVELIGGEPTLHPDLIDFCQKISTYNIKCSIYSNFSSKLSLYKTLINVGIHFTLSTHYENKNFIEKLKHLPLNFINSYIDIRAMLEIEHYYESKTLCEKLLIQFSTIFEPALIQYNNSIQYSSEQINFYNYINANVTKKTVYAAIYNDGSIEKLTVNDAESKFKNFKYWLCNAGLEYFYIHADGNVYSCINQYIYNQTPRYNIMTTDFNNIKLKNMICIYDTCPCIWEVEKNKVLSI